MGKFEKFLFCSAIFLNFSYYGILNIAIKFALPNSLISGGIRLYIFAAAMILLGISFARRTFPKFKIPIYALAIYFVFLLGVLFLDNWNKYPPDLSAVQFMGSPKLFHLYVIVLLNLGTFLLFFVDKIRFSYLLKNPWIIYAASFISVFIILIVNRGALDTLSITGSDANVNRSQVISSLNVLYALSMYYMIFSSSFLKKILLGGAGVALSILNLIICDSRTALLTFAVITLFYALTALRSVLSFLMMSITLAVGAMLAMPIVLKSRAFERVSKLMYFQQDYNLTGDAELSRIDLWGAALDEFWRSPLWGGSISIPGLGGYSHLILTDVLMATGLIGASLILVVFIGMARGYIFIYSKFGESKWLCAMMIAPMMHELTAGSSYSIISYMSAFLLMADSMRSDAAFYNKSNPMLVQRQLWAAPNSFRKF